MMAKDLGEQVEAYRTRPSDAGPYTFVAADALVLKIRQGGRVANIHAPDGTGVNADGHREVLGIQAALPRRCTRLHTVPKGLWRQVWPSTTTSGSNPAATSHSTSSSNPKPSEPCLPTKRNRSIPRPTWRSAPDQIQDSRGESVTPLEWT